MSYCTLYGFALCGSTCTHAAPQGTMPCGIPCCAGCHAKWITMPCGIPCRVGYFARGTSCRVSWHVRCAQKCKRPIAAPYHRRSSGRSAPLRSVTYCPLPCLFVLLVCLLHADAPWSLAPRGERTHPTCTRRSTHSSSSRPSERQGCERQAGKIPHRRVSRTSVRCCSFQPTWLRLRSRQRSPRPFAAGVVSQGAAS